MLRSCRTRTPESGDESGSAEPGSLTEEEPGDPEPVPDSVDSAITMKKVTGTSGEDPEGFMNGDEIEAGIRFASGQELDELALTVRPVNLDLTAFRMPAFENAGETVYSVIQLCMILTRQLYNPILHYISDKFNMRFVKIWWILGRSNQLFPE